MVPCWRAACGRRSRRVTCSCFCRAACGGRADRPLVRSQDGPLHAGVGRWVGGDAQVPGPAARTACLHCRCDAMLLLLQVWVGGRGEQTTHSLQSSSSPRPLPPLLTALRRPSLPASACLCLPPCTGLGNMVADVVGVSATQTVQENMKRVTWARPPRLRWVPSSMRSRSRRSCSSAAAVQASAAGA